MPGTELQARVTMGMKINMISAFIKIHSGGEMDIKESQVYK